MFERFTASARSAVTAAAGTAARDAAPELGTGRLLLALCADPGPAGAALRATGVTAEAVRRRLDEGVETDLDPEGLADLGIDLDDVRRRVEETFGPGALDRAGHRRHRGRRRHPGGGSSRFSPGAVRALGRAVRRAAGDHALGSEHLLGGLLDEPDVQTIRILAACGTDADRVHAALDRATRRTA